VLALGAAVVWILPVVNVSFFLPVVYLVGFLGWVLTLGFVGPLILTLRAELVDWSGSFELLGAE